MRDAWSGWRGSVAVGDWATLHGWDESAREVVVTCAWTRGDEGEGMVALGVVEGDWFGACWSCGTRWD